jgi:hypothetical protein
MGMADPNNHDFTLTSDADILLDKASDNYAPKDDYFGNTRPSGKSADIGAYEYTSSTGNEYAPSAPQGLKVLQ